MSAIQSNLGARLILMTLPVPQETRQVETHNLFSIAKVSVVGMYMAADPEYADADSIKLARKKIEELLAFITDQLAKEKWWQD